jgi:hypothetical protein
MILSLHENLEKDIKSSFYKDAQINKYQENFGI